MRSSTSTLIVSKRTLETREAGGLRCQEECTEMQLVVRTHDAKRSQGCRQVMTRIPYLSTSLQPNRCCISHITMHHPDVHGTNGQQDKASLDHNPATAAACKSHAPVVRFQYRCPDSHTSVRRFAARES